MKQNSLIVILNPKSGDGDDYFRGDIEKSLRQSGATYEIRETRADLSGEKLVRQAIKDGARDIVACGGDRTVLSVVNGIARSQAESGENSCTLLIVPGGTANLVATALQISRNRGKRRARGVAVVVANAGTIGGKHNLAPRAKMDDGKLDLCILHSFGFRDLLRPVWRSLRSQLERERSVSFYQTQRIEIATDPPLHVQIDGEPEEDLQLPLICEVVPSALRVRVPGAETKN